LKLLPNEDSMLAPAVLIDWIFTVKAVSST
jgi:hypothetical protein